MSQSSHCRRNTSCVKPGNTTEKLLEDILVDAYGEDEPLWAFQQAFESAALLPAEGTVIGETVSVTKIEYDGNPQRGLRAICKKADSKTYEIALADVEFPVESKATPYQQAYRQWLAVPTPKSRRTELRERIKQTKAVVGEIDLSKPVELIVLGIKKQETARCRLPGKDKELTLRTSGLWKVAPGEIVTVMPKKHWSYAGHPYLSADITDTRFDLAALNLTPLKLTDEGAWDPKDECWGKEDDSLPEWTQEIIARGPRTQYQMEKILPGVKPEDLDIDTDPILQAVELKERGDIADAAQVLNSLLLADLRCLDAHAHLGNLEFDRSPEMALRHYDIGCQIGELSLGPDFKGVLRWAMLENRPYLRCLNGYGLCLWRLKRFDESVAVFTRMLWLNPSDNQGAQFNLREVRAGEEWMETDSGALQSAQA